MNQIAVAKIGGSILRNPQGMVDALNVMEKHPQIKVVIVSATYNTTNELEEIAKASVLPGKESEELLERLLKKHLAYVKDLKLPTEVEGKVLDIISQAKRISNLIKNERDLSAKNMDAIYAIGELLSSNLIKSYFEKNLPYRNVSFLDARELIKTDSEFNCAKPLKKELNKRVERKLIPLLGENSLIIIPGFIGSNETGDTTTLGREGSDYSAALLAEAISADELQIWKDVPGIFTGDPKLIKNAQAVGEIGFEEVNRFSEKGAKILFPSALIPVMNANIPVYIGWIHDHSKGTKIFKKIEKAPKLIGVTKVSELLRFELEKKNPKVSDVSFFENVKAILEKENIHFLAAFLESSRVIFHVTIKEKFPEGLIKHFEEFSKISKFPNISLICLVGVDVEHFGSKISLVLTELEEEGISLILAERNKDFLTFSFPSRVEEKVINYFHDKLFLKK